VVGAGIGVRPQIDFVRGTPIHVDKAILVNEYLETSAPGVYAAGDCAQIWDRWTQKHTLDVLWPTAIAAGRVAGLNMAGGRTAYVKGTPFNACLLFGLHITAIGQLGGVRDESEPEVFQHMSRGSSEIWATRPHAYASAWSQAGLNTVRLALSDDRLVGALVVGEQTLADPLRDLIDMQVNILPLRPYLEQGGAEMAQKVQQYWKLMKRCAANAPLTRVMM
jgi:NADPH-dependent 2,4-dienoyl-CoA reductase/sulfur reductase-like enzyme